MQKSDIAILLRNPTGKVRHTHCRLHLYQIKNTRIMYDIMLRIHSLTPYLFILIMFAVLVMSISALSTGKFTAVHKSLARVAMILAHIQLLFGIFLLFFGDFARSAWATGMGNVMKTSELRLALVEHPLTMIIGVVLITIGFSRSKKAEAATAKNRNILIFFTIGFVLMLSRIPYQAWLNLG